MNTSDCPFTKLFCTGHGGKADGLYRLAQLASESRHQIFKVPAFFVIVPDWQPGLSSLRQLKSTLRSIVQTESTGSRDRALFAVRSSAKGEDGKKYSFAGQLDSFLDVPMDKVSRRILDVRASLNSPRIKSYLQLSGLEVSGAGSVYVIVQQMVNATVSGIAFSYDPIKGETAQPLANVVAGYGDKLVSGHCNGQSIWLKDDKPDQVKAPGQDPTENLLNQKQINRLRKALLLIEERWQCPVDIEFCFDQSDLYIVQARPITTAKGAVEDSTIFDASNIQESYPGTTSPLTFSFARRAYSQVYQSFVRLLGVPVETIKERSDIFDYMLAYHQHKIYYNMQSWYGVVAMLPFYKTNRVFMEQMMGVKSKANGELDRSRHFSGSGLISTSLSILKIGYAALTLKSSINAFNDRLDKALSLDKSAVEQMSLTQLTNLFLKLEGALVNHWDAPVTNDFFAMIAFGLLKAALKKYNIPDTDVHLYLKGDSAVISSAPPQLLATIARLIAQDKKLAAAMTAKELAATSNTAEMIRLIESSGAVHKLYLSYLEQFGDRSLSELKLEVPSVKDDPTVLLKTIVAMVASYNNNGPAQDSQDILEQEYLQVRQSSIDSSQDARRAVCQAPIVMILSKLTAKLIAQRENLRFARTRVFGIVRLIFNTMGKRLFEAGRLKHEHDIFYLSVDEILGFVRGTALNLDLNALVQLRQCESFATVSPCRIEFTGAYGLSDIFASTTSATSQDGLVLEGIAASRGKIRGIARVINDPASQSLNKGEILVAERTDPGWIVHFALAGGLVTDFGSLLSHTAIVSRELALPCVVAVPGATSTICSGDYIEVDGNSGRVTILKRAVADLLDAA